MRYEVDLNWSHAPIYADDRGTVVTFDHGLETIRKIGWETAPQAIRRIYPDAAIWPIAN